MGDYEVIPCTEQGEVDVPIERFLDASGELKLHPDVEGSTYFEVSTGTKRLRLRAKGWVGFVPLTDTLVAYIAPRVPISNLTRMVRMAGQPRAPLTSFRGYETDGGWSDSLLEVYAETFKAQLEEVITGGLWRDYEERFERSSFPRGRLLVNRTVQDLVPRGIHHEAHVAWFERTADIPVNRCLRYAIRSLVVLLRGSPGHSKKLVRELVRELSAFDARFDGVTLDAERDFEVDPFVRGERPLPALRAYYRQPLDVAMAIIGRRGVLLNDNYDGSLKLASLAYNMNDVFEAYVHQTLRQYGDLAGWPAAVLDDRDGKQSLYADVTKPEATPDVVIRRPDGGTPLAIEVKNKPYKGIPKADDRNQAIVYALSYGSDKALVVRPCGSVEMESGLSRLGTVGGIDVFQYLMGLGAPDLEAEERKFGDAVAGLLPDDFDYRA